MNLSAKDLSYLHDHLSFEMLAAKKYEFYAHQCEDPALNQLMHEMCDRHKQHYHKLLGHLANGLAQ